MAAVTRRSHVAVRVLSTALGLGIACALGSVPRGEAVPLGVAPVAADTDLTPDEASARARSTGESVEATAETTETNRVLARADGTFELEAHRDAVRTDINGSWEPIDTTLVVQPDGTIQPRAITLPVSFAEGGSTAGPVVRAGEGDNSLAFDWDEGPLPAPVVDGNQVTYPEVRPGVDLVFTAHATGFSEALVVESAAAAATLAEDPIEFIGTSQGLDLSTDSEGTLAATAAGSEAALVSPRPLAWDSSGGGEGVNEPSAATMGTGALHELSPPEITRSEASPESSVTIEVAPPASALSDPGTVYPLYLDPPISGILSSRFRTMHSGGWNYGTPSTDVMRVGYCDWSGCNDSFQRNARSFFEFDMSALTAGRDGGDPVIFDASVQADQVWNADSASQPVQLRKTTRSFTASDDYPGPVGTSLQQISSAAGHAPNSAKTLTFDNASIADYVETEAAAENAKISFALSAPYENNKYFWKKFGSDTRLSVVYAYRPRITDFVSTNTVACPHEYVQSTGNLDVRITADPLEGNPPMDFAAQVFSNDVDNNGPWDLTTLVRSSGWQSNGSNDVWTTSFAGLPQGRYAWRANALAGVGARRADGTEYPGLSTSTDPALRQVYVDRTKPAAPYLASDDYPRDYWGRHVSSPGNILAVIPADAAGIGYAFDGRTPPSVQRTDCTYTGTGFKPRSAAIGNIIPIPAPAGMTPGVPHSVTVYTFDKAHNPSDPVTYSFYVSPKLDGSTPTNRVEVESEAVVKTDDPTGAVSIQGEITPPVAPATTPAPGPGQYLTLSTTDPNAYVDVKVPVTAPGYYAFGAKVAPCATCGEVRFSLVKGQVEAEAGVNTTDPATGEPDPRTAGLGYVQMGGYPALIGASATPTVRIRFPQASAADPSSIKIDFFTVAQIQGGLYGDGSKPIQDNLALAFNNDGIASEGGTRASLEPGTTKALSAQKLAALGIVPGGTFTTTFQSTTGEPVTASFPIPRATQEGDNVIAAGQHIAMPSGTIADHVDLLLAATCVPARSRPAVAFDLVHPGTDGVGTVTTNRELTDTVPHWLTSTSTSLTPLEMPGYVSGSPATAAPGAARLYVMELDVEPARRDRPLLEVGLPNTNTDFRQPCGGVPRIHVLAMTTRKNP